MKNENQVRKTLKKLKKQRDESVVEIDQLKAQVTALQEQVKTASETATAQTKAESNVEVAKLQAGLHTAASVLAHVEANKLVLERELAAVKEERDAAQAAVKTNLQVIEQHEQRIGELLKLTEDADIKRYQRRVREKSEEIDALSTELRKAKDEKQELMLVARELQRQVNWLRAKDAPPPAPAAPPAVAEAVAPQAPQAVATATP